MSPPSRWLWLLVLVDLGLIAAHLLAARLTAGPLDLSWLTTHRWRVDGDGGVAESFQYLKYLAVAGLALLLYRRHGFVSALPLCLFALVLLVDDAFRVHERLGGPLGALLVPGSEGDAGASPQPLLLLTRQTVGELASWLVHGSVFLAYLAAARRSDRPRERRLAWRVTGLVAVLALFGALVDALNGPIVYSATLSVLKEGVERLDVNHIGLLLAFPNLPESVTLTMGAAQVKALLSAANVTGSLRELRLLVVGLAVLEDGGEMIALSLLAASLGAATRAPRPAA